MQYYTQYYIILLILVNTLHHILQVKQLLTVKQDLNRRILKTKIGQGTDKNRIILG